MKSKQGFSKNLANLSNTNQFINTSHHRDRNLLQKTLTGGFNHTSFEICSASITNAQWNKTIY
jgi:hypothetical protein